MKLPVAPNNGDRHFSKLFNAEETKGIIHSRIYPARDVVQSVWYIYIYIQYWSVDGKYRIYLTRLRNGVKDELLVSLSPRFAPSQINSIFTVNRPILYLSCNPRCPKK